MHVLFFDKEKDENKEIFSHMRKSVHVFELDSYRKYTKDHVFDKKRKRSKSNLYDLDYEDYNKYIISDPNERSRIFGKTHILFTDFLRTSTICGNKKIINEYNYSNEIVDNKKDLVPTSLTGLIDIQEIPEHLQIDNIDEIYDNMYVIQALNIIRANLDVMIQIGLGEPIYIIYIVTYHLLLQELNNYKYRLNCEEVELLNDLIKETSVLYTAVNVNITNKRLNDEVKSLRVKYKESVAQSEDYLNIIRRLERIDVIFKNDKTEEENETFLRLFLNKYELEFELVNSGNNIFSLTCEDVVILITFYNLLAKHYELYPNIFIPIFIFREAKSMVRSDDIQKFKIVGQGTSWAVVFYLLFGPNVPYTKEKDQAVRSLIKLAEKTGIPLEMLLPKYDKQNH